MLPDCSRKYLLKKILGACPPNLPSKFTAAPLDRQISVFINNTIPCLQIIKISFRPIITFQQKFFRH